MKAYIVSSCILLLCGSVLAHTPEKGSDVELNTRGVWAITPDPNLPNVFTHISALNASLKGIILSD